jgi:hypothetical protein
VSQVSEESRERLLSSLTETGGQLRVKNAMNPILYLCGIVVPSCMAGLVYGTHWMTSVVCALGFFAAIGTAIYSYVHFMHSDPDRLQSEEYNIQQRKLDMIQEKGTAIAVVASSVPTISQSEFLALPPSASGGEE